MAWAASERRNNAKKCAGERPTAADQMNGGKSLKRNISTSHATVVVLLLSRVFLIPNVCSDFQFEKSNPPLQTPAALHLHVISFFLFDKWTTQNTTCVRVKSLSFFLCQSIIIHKFYHLQIIQNTCKRANIHILTVIMINLVNYIISRYCYHNLL